MKTFFGATVLLTFVLCSQGVLNDDWPKYIKRCPRNDPNFNYCALVTANMALPTILKGDDNYGFPNMAPLTFDYLHLGRNQSWRIDMRNVKVLGLQKMGVTGFNWDWKKQSVSVNIMYLGSVIFRGQYTSTGRFGDINVNGRGNIDIILVGGSYGTNLTYNMNYSLMNIKGQQYAQIRDSSCGRQSGFRIEFTNELLTKENAQRDEDYVNAHADEAVKQLSPDLSKILCDKTTENFNAILYNFPIDVIAPHA